MKPGAVSIMQFHFSVVIGSQLADQQAAARCRLWHFSDVTAQADDVSPLGLFRCEHRDSDFDRSAYDHKRMRPLKPMVGGGQISGVLSPRTGGSDSYGKSSVFLKRKAHLCELPRPRVRKAALARVSNLKTRK